MASILLDIKNNREMRNTIRIRNQHWVSKCNLIDAELRFITERL
jgi:hypothetical protein